MKIEYERFYPYPIAAGEHVTIYGIDWVCLLPCTILGVTMETREPVVKRHGKTRVNTVELMLASEKRNSVCLGRTSIEIKILNQYTKLSSPKEVVGKVVKACTEDDRVFKVVFEDNSYLAVETVHEKDYDGDHWSYLKWRDLTVNDLHVMNLVSDDTLKEIKQEQDAALKDSFQHNRRLEAAQKLNDAVTTLGLDTVKEMLS